MRVRFEFINVYTGGLTESGGKLGVRGFRKHRTFRSKSEKGQRDRDLDRGPGPVVRGEGRCRVTDDSGKTGPLRVGLGAGLPSGIDPPKPEDVLRNCLRVSPERGGDTGTPLRTPKGVTPIDIKGDLFFFFTTVTNTEEINLP